MLLKLIPGRQEPTIHYTISFADLPASLPSPASWTVQMSHLFREDLEVPATLHSLDRAAGIPSLLEEVSLDLEMREVRCRFIDGSVEQFGFDHNGKTLAGSFTDALEDIVTVVAESTREDEKAKREREQQRSRSMSVALMPAAPVKPSGKVVGKHKKQRSLFMQLVSCVQYVYHECTYYATVANIFPPVPWSARHHRPRLLYLTAQQNCRHRTREPWRQTPLPQWRPSHLHPQYIYPKRLVRLRVHAPCAELPGQHWLTPSAGLF